MIIDICLKPEHFEESVCDILNRFGDSKLSELDWTIGAPKGKFVALFECLQGSDERYTGETSEEVDTLGIEFKSVGCLKCQLTKEGERVAEELICEILGWKGEVSWV